MVTWDGVERRKDHDCYQENRLQRIETTADGTVTQLAKLNETLIRLDTFLSGKISVFDAHVANGERWRSDMFKILISACLAGVTATVGFGIWVGRQSNQIEVNTNRLSVLEVKANGLVR